MSLEPCGMYGSLATQDTKVRVGVGVIIWKNPRELLLEKRRDCGWWGLPGGKVEAGESLRNAAIREVAEETGLIVDVADLVGVYSEPGGRIAVYPDNGDMVHLVDVVVEAHVVSGHLKCSEESEELRFFQIDRLPDELVPPARQPIVDAIERKRGVLR